MLDCKNIITCTYLKLLSSCDISFNVELEVEEHFVVSIVEVSGNASIDSLTSNVTLVILKHGMPNGLFGFESGASQVVSENSGIPVVLIVERRKGRKGTVEVNYRVASKVML